MRAVRNCVAGLLTLVLAVAVAAQQDKSKRPSPPGQAEVTLQGQQITVDYSRPKIRNPKTGEPRHIFGSGTGFVVPYGKVWRLGANEATTMKTQANLDINGKQLPAGTYTLFAIPNEDHWTLIVSKKTGEWGIPYPGDEYDLFRTDVPTSKLDSPVQEFTISFEKSGDDAATMNMDWENTRVSAPIKVAR
jgi:hypothetical protein